MRIGRLTLRLWAVAVLMLGIVVMHHIARSGHDAAVSHQSSVVVPVQVDVPDHGMGADVASGSVGTAAGDDAPPADHDLLHLCLAAMTAAAVVLVGWLLLARRLWTTTSPFVVFRARPAPARRPPRPHGSALLMSLCVMRT